MYNTLGETVMKWMSGMTDKMEHGSAELSQEIMTALEVPREGFGSVQPDFSTAREVFDAVISDDKCVGRAAPRTEAALKVDSE